VTTRRNDPQASLLGRSAPFVIPFVLFLTLLGVEDYFPDQHYLFYPVKVVTVTAALAYYWRALPVLKPSAPLASVAVGVIGIVLWVGLDSGAIRFNMMIEDSVNRAVNAVGLTSWQMTVEGGHPQGRNPFLLYPVVEAWALFAIRVLGISLIVPIMEELFWRGFVMRWLIREDFASVPLGTYQLFSFGVTTMLFALEHGSEWLLGLIVGAVFGAWFIRTKSLGNVMVAHGTTNLLLALYCLVSKDWHFLSVLAPTTAPR
jgi:uncharacterized protein